MKILHVLYQSYPNISGSSTRSSDLISAQKALGLYPVVITSPFQNGLSDNRIEVINGVSYYRTFSGRNSELVSESKSSSINELIKIFRIIPFTFKLYQVARREKVDVIHAHAMFFCAIPAKIVSLLIKRKMIYEVRSLWEERGTRSGFGKSAIKYLEKMSLNLSKQFIVINSKLKMEFVARGYQPDCIHVVPNAINLDRIHCARNVTFERKEREDLIFAYIGSISPIEGLDNAIKVFCKLKDVNGVKNKLFIYGDGVEFNRLVELVDDLGMQDQVLFQGKFTSKDIPFVYSKIDVVINPRVKSKITDSVTPLKPLEALAYFKLFIGSDVGGISELIDDGVNGILFNSEDPDDLCSKILWVLDPQNKKICSEIVRNGEQFVRDERSWRVNAEKYIHIYEKL